MKKMKKISTILLALVVVMCGVLTTATTAEAATPKPTKITLSTTSRTIYMGQSYTLSVKKVNPSNASKSVKWKTSNPKVATVSSKGKVTAVKAGTATITATSKSNSKVKATCKITVKPVVKSMKMRYKNSEGKYVTAPTSSSKALSLAYGKTLTLKADYTRVSSKYNWTKSAKWSVPSKYKKYVTISNIKPGKNYSTAVIKANKLTPSGTAIKVTATATDGSGKSASMYLKVVKAKQTITTSATTYSKTYGASAFSLGAKSKQGGKLSYKVISGTSCVSVSTAGKVTIKQAGAAKIRITAAATGNYAETTKDVTVKIAKAENKDLAIENVKEMNSLFIRGAKGDANVTFESSDSEVVKVDERTGDYTLGKKAGIATITAKVSETTNYLGKEITIEIVNPELGYYENVWPSYRVYKLDMDKDYKFYTDTDKVLFNYTDLKDFVENYRNAINGSFTLAQAWNACTVTDASGLLSFVSLADNEFELTGEETYTVVEDKKNNSKTVTVKNATAKWTGTYVMTMDGNVLHIVKDGKTTKNIEIQQIASGYQVTVNKTINGKSVALHILATKTSESKMHVEFKVNDYNTAGLIVEETLGSTGIPNGWSVGIHVDGFNKYRSELGIDYTLDDIHVYPIQL